MIESSSHAGTVMLDTTCKPELHFGFHPAYGPQPDAYPIRESVLGLELVNHRASEPGDFADLRQTKNLDGCHSHQDYASQMEIHEGKNSGETRNYLPNTQATVETDVGFWCVSPCYAG